MSEQYAVLDAGKTSVGEVRQLPVGLRDGVLMCLAYYEVIVKSQDQEVTGQQEESSSTCTGLAYLSRRMDTTYSARFSLTETVAFVVPSPDTTTWSVSGGAERIMVGLSSWPPRDSILSPPVTPISDAFERERQAFLSMRENLLTRAEYRGKFVAVLNGKVVDHDENKAELAKRCYKRHGYIPMYMTKVDETERVLEMPSPE